jgi:hypothetical protein
MEHLRVDFYLTKTCNATCHYCTAWTKEKRNLVVDLKFLRSTLEKFKPHKTHIQLLGGEPGLVKNLREVVDMIKEYDNFKISILSNSVIRKRYPWVLEDPDITYIEHLVLDFYEDRIEKLGRYEFLPENNLNNYNLIIMTPNYEKYKHKYNLISLNHKNTMFKEYNSRSPTYVASEQAPEFERRICAAFPMVPVVDFEIQKIRHCSKKVINGSRQFEITQENIDKMMNFELFEYEDYCKKCMEPIPARSREQILRIMEVGKV